MSITKYSQFISLHEQKTKTIGLRSILKNPKSLREDVHVLDNEGETHVKVTGAKSVRELDKGIKHHLKTHHGFSHDDVEDYYDDAYHDSTPYHHHKPGKGSTPQETRTKEEHVKDIAGRVAQLKKDDEQ